MRSTSLPRRVSCWAACGRSLAVPMADMDSKTFGSRERYTAATNGIFSRVPDQDANPQFPRHCLSRRRLWFKVSSFFLVALSRAGQTPVFRHLSTQRHGHPLCSATLKGNLFNFTVQSVSARLGEVGTSIATRVVTKKQGRSNSRVKLRFRSLWHLPSINKQ
jgi:hypothetical protein